MMRKHLKATLNKNNQTGATAVEFAVIAAILFVILFGILEFGFIFMQEHYVANAAREGVRVGVRANNYDCFDGNTGLECNVDRQDAVVAAVSNYLSSLYGPANILSPVAGTDDVERIPDENSSDNKTLRVTVEVNNFFPPILSSLAALLPGTGFELPSTISYTAQGEYEDPSEP
jgi:Flp pilus assembly protein TadG